MNVLGKVHIPRKVAIRVWVAAKRHHLLHLRGVIVLGLGRRETLVRHARVEPRGRNTLLM